MLVRARRLLLIVALACPLAARAAVPSSDKLLPDSVKGFVSAGNVPTFVEHWETTRLHRMFDDPAMKEFGDDLVRQLREKWLKSNEKIGLSFEDFQNIASGELAAAMATAEDGRGALVVIVDVTGNEDRAREALKKATDNLLHADARQSQQQIDGATVMIYEQPSRTADTEPRRVAYVLKDSVLIGSESVAVVKDLLAHFDGQRNDSLAASPAYQVVMKQCAAAGEAAEADLRWFVRPLDFAAAVRAGNAEKEKTIKLLGDEGFSAIQAVGGQVRFAVAGHDIQHRTYVYAPPPYARSMRMLSFPNGADLAPPDWIPARIAAYTSFQWDVKNAFESFGTMFDAVIGEGQEGVFEDTIRSAKEDPEGPGVDIRNDLVAHLGNRCHTISDYKLPITPTSERIAIAIEATNESALAESVRKSMETDPLVEKIAFGPYTIWEMKADEETGPPVLVENGNDPLFDDLDDGEDEGPKKIPNSAVAVARGQLLIASHVDFLQSLLSEGEAVEKLATDPAYLRVAAALKDLGADMTAAVTFSNIHEEYRATYDLFREGKLPEAQTMTAQLINAIVGEEEEGVIRKAKLDGSMLPEFDVVRPYLTTAGSFVKSQDTGWLIVGFFNDARPSEAAVTAARGDAGAQ